MLALVALYAAMGSLKISDAVRAFERRTLVVQAPTTSLEDTLDVDGSLSWPTLRLDLGYGPRVTEISVLGPGSPETLWLHNARAQLVLQHPRYTLSVLQSLTVGEQDFSQFGPIAAPQAGSTNALPTAAGPAPMTTTATADHTATQPTAVSRPAAGTPLPALNLLPNTRAVRVLDEQTAAQFNVLWTRRVHAGVHAGFGFLGGADAAAQRFLPRQRVARLDGSVAYDWSRRDQVGTILSSRQIETSNGYSHWLASISEDWSARWSSTSSSVFGFGVAYQDTSGPEGTTATRWGPLGLASVSYGTSWSEIRLRYQAALTYAPDVNILIGRLQNRLQATALASASTGRMDLSVTIGSSQTIPAAATGAATLANAALALERELYEWLWAQLGAQIARQSFAGAAAPTGTTWLIYVGLIARPPELRL